MPRLGDVCRYARGKSHAFVKTSGCSRCKFDDGVVPKDMSDWAHHVSTVGNVATGLMLARYLNVVLIQALFRASILPISDDDMRPTS